MRKFLFTSFVVLCLLSPIILMVLSSTVQIVEASGTIYIRANGVVQGTDKIVTGDNIIYTFIDNINDSIWVERSNIIIDGNNYTLQKTGPASGDGFRLMYVSNVSIKHTNIKGFTDGVYLFNSTNNTLFENDIATMESIGIYLVNSSNNTISGNNITDCREGIYIAGLNNNNNICENNIREIFYNGVSLYDSSNTSISGNNITNCRLAGSAWVGGIFARYISNTSISGNNITNCWEGIIVSESSNNSISGNKIRENTAGGIFVGYSNNTSLSKNNITDNYCGIDLTGSSRSFLQSNLLDGNQYGLDVMGSELSHYLHSIDTSNLVDGKPVYYLISQHDITINSSTHSDVGFLALINSTNITVEGLNLSNNFEGLIMAYTNNTRIQNNNMTNNFIALVIFPASSNNSIIRNNIAKNLWGIYLPQSSNNTISENNIAHCEYGVAITNSSNNTFYHNNFIENTFQVYDDFWEEGEVSSFNTWDNSLEGNYWSNYTGVDLDFDGIGDTVHIIDVNNTDNSPLMGIFNSFSTSMGKHVEIISNSTIEDFAYFGFNSTIRIFVSNMTENQTHGFVRMCIPHSLMFEPYNVTIDGANPTYWNYTLYDNGTHRWIYFEYEHSTKEVVIIPEFPVFTTLPLLMTLAALVTLVYRRKHT